jgi:hypothetical protein
MKEMRNRYKILARKPKRKRPFGKCEEILKWILQKLGERV